MALISNNIYPLKRICYKFQVPKELENLISSFTGKRTNWIQNERNILYRE